MGDRRLISMLEEGAKTLGAPMSPHACAQFMGYLRELKVWNARMNLTAIEADEDIVTRHFLDSLTPFALLKGVARLLDAGAGAGFPGIPIKIVRPDMAVTLLDSVSKKVIFMRHIARAIGIGPDIEAVAARLEDKAVVTRYAATFDAVISRAFTSLPAFLEMSLPYLAPGGIIIAMKGPKAIEEVAGLQRHIAGLEFEGIREVEVPFANRRTALVVFRRHL